MTQRMIKSLGSQSRKMAWANAKAEGISKGTHIYINSYHSLDYFKSREDLTKEISVRNLTFNNGGL
tara:strand:+ start:307 stop:504 length:198 start_codon:yes stop_codon:yes gene_type:complete